MHDRGGADQYRPDIDGLRAIAVLAVLVYHANSTLLPGGFVGVDVFFVISGFLISGLIFTRLDKDAFSLLDFYRRRVQRIAPAMFVVVAATLAAAYLLLLPRDSADTARAAVFSVASLGNVYFWLYGDQSYFAADSRELPLLHLWSLGVEEQFYMVWPLVLLAIGKGWRTRSFLAGCVVAAGVSFVLGDMLFAWDPSFTYYLLPTRAGELLAGAVVSALLLNGDIDIAPGRRAWLGVAGAVAIGASMFLYDDATIFPGLRALLPTLGTASLLLAGSPPHRGPVTRLLASRPFVAIGLISYSVYLWHWPLMALYRYGFGELSSAAQVTLCLLSLLLGAVSYALVEQPARAVRFPPVRTIALGYGVPAVVIAAAGLVIVYGPRLGVPVHDQRYLTKLTELNDKTRPAFAFGYVCQSQRLNAADLADPDCVVGPHTAAEPRVVLWGDSNAAHYIGVLGRAAERGRFSFRNIEIGSCPPVAADPAPFVEPRRLRDCRASAALAWPAVQRYPVVVLSASWTLYDQASTAFFPAVVDTVNQLVERGTLVVLLGKMPIFPGYDRRCPGKQLTFPFLDCPAFTLPIGDEVKDVNARLGALAEERDRVEYFDMTRYLCPNGWCRSTGASGEPLYYDRSHLSMAASWKLGSEIQKRYGMPPAFAAIAATAEPVERP